MATMLKLNLIVILVIIWISAYNVSNQETWSNWSTCYNTCGRNRRIWPCKLIKSRCKNLEHQERFCESTSCGEGRHWYKWSSWSECSTTCGRGTRKKTRIKTNCTDNNCPDLSFYHISEFCQQTSCPTASVQTSRPSFAEHGKSTVQSAQPMSSEPHNRPVENKNLKTTGRFSTKLSALTNYPGIRLTSSKALISSTIDRDKTEILLNTTISTPTTVRQDTVLNKGTVQNTITPLRSSNLMTRKASKAPSRLNSITGISVTSRRSSVNKLSTDSTSKKDETLIITLTSSLLLTLILAGVVVSSVKSFNRSRMKTDSEMEESETTIEEHLG